MGGVRRSLGLALALLALTGAEAHAVTYDFSVTPAVPSEDQVTTFRLTPAKAKLDRVEWDFDGNWSTREGTSRAAARTYADPGPVTVRMAAREDEDSGWQIVTKTITVNAKPAPDFDFAPQRPLAGQDVAFSARATDPEGDAVTFTWDFDDGDRASGPTPAHAYDRAGTYDVTLTAEDEHGATATKTLSVTVAADPGPWAAFDFAPAAPLAGEAVTFTSRSTPSQGSITALDWDLDGDGRFDDAQGATATWTYAAAGVHAARLRVRQSNGRAAIAFADVTVSERPAAPPPGTGQPGVTLPSGGEPRRSPARRLVRMRPFPVVRIAGVVLARGADVRVLSVRAPRGARVLVRCRGRGCPTGTVARSSATRVLRLRRFERRLRAGISLEVFVRKAGRIGKYTRFRIRAGKPPSRVDMCLRPDRTRPTRCP